MPGLSALHCLLVIVERYPPCQPDASLCHWRGWRRKGLCLVLCALLIPVLWHWRSPRELLWHLLRQCPSNSAALAWVPVMRLFIYLKGDRHCQACSAGTWVGLLAAFWWVRQPLHPGGFAELSADSFWADCVVSVSDGSQPGELHHPVNCCLPALNPLCTLEYFVPFGSF